MGRVVVPQRKDSIGGAKAPPILYLYHPDPVEGPYRMQVGPAEKSPHVFGCVSGTAGFAAMHAVRPCVASLCWRDSIMRLLFLPVSRSGRLAAEGRIVRR